MTEPSTSENVSLKEVLHSLTGAVINLSRELFLTRKCLRALVEEDKVLALEALDNLYDYDDAMDSVEKALKDLAVWVAAGNG